MAITVKHKFVSAIPDAGDPTIVQPSNWNDDHDLVGTVPVSNGGTGASTLIGYVKGNGTAAMTAATTIPNTDVTGLGTMSTQNANNVTITGGSISGVTVSGYIPTTEKAVANGVATLDGSGTVPISQLPSAVLGALSYQGTWNASTNTPTLTSSVGTKGYYYVVSVAGSTNLNGIIDWQVGDWAVYNGSAWQKIDNTDAVTSVNGYTGTVVLTQPDIAGTVPTSRTISTGTGLTGGGDLSANRTISFSDSNVATWAATPSSANLAAAMTDETGSGSLVFGTNPTLSAPVIDGANPYIQFNNGSAVTVAAGKLWYDGSTGSWNAGMGGGNITQQIGEELFIYGKASAAITDSPLQIVYHTGTVGASGVITFAPTVAGITDVNAIVGVATENIALNGFGRVTAFGVVHGITTNGTAYGETWADDDVIWYNPVTGNPTKVKPVAPNMKIQVGLVIKAGAGGSGSFQVDIKSGSQLGGTDSNVQITSPANGNILTYDGGNSYWKNTDLTAGTGISVSKSANGVLTVTNTSPSSGGTVTSITAGTGLSGGTITSSGTIAIDSTVATLTGIQTLTNKTISGASNTLTNIGNSSLTNSAITINGTSTSLGGSISVGTVTGVTATSPVVSSGGTAPVISMPAATSSVNGYLTSTDWTTFNNKGSGTVTSVTGTAPVVSSGGATPAISMAAATGSVNGYLTSTDWTTFNNKGNGTVTSVSALTLGTTGTDLSSTVATGTTTPVITLNVPTASASNRGALSSTDWTTFNNKAPAVTYTSTYVPYGQGTTTPALSANFTYDASLLTLTAPQMSVSNGIVCNANTIATNFSIPAGSNAMSAGPITINTGVTVTVPTGSTWVVV